MGAAARHRRKFLETHSCCAFCGGKAPATTIEHCPPRAMFQFRLWPEGFEFPSCEPCNQGSDDDDLLIAMLARIDPFDLKGDPDGKQEGLIKAVNRQFPGLIGRMIPSAAEARRNNRELGVQPAPGQTHQEAGAVKLPAEFHNAVCVFSRKLSKGIYYRETGTPFPDDGCLLLNWFTNADIVRTGKYSAFEALKELAGDIPMLHRGATHLNDQFEYKLSISPDRDIFVLQAIFGNSFGVVVFGCTQKVHLERAFTRLQEKTGRNGPFAVLQSPVLAA